MSVVHFTNSVHMTIWVQDEHITSSFHSWNTLGPYAKSFFSCNKYVGRVFA